MKPQIHYIGKKIKIKAIRDFILDKELREVDTILLHSTNFDDIVNEYRDTYFESIQLPYFLIKIFINEDKYNNVPLNRIGVVKNDQDPNRPSRYEMSDTNELDKTYDFLDGEIVYRCHWCGNIVDMQGDVLISAARERIINYLENYDSPIVHHKNGKCCPEHAENS